MTFALCIYSPAYLLHACVACMCISAARSVAVERLPLQHKVYAVHFCSINTGCLSVSCQPHL